MTPLDTYMKTKEYWYIDNHYWKVDHYLGDEDVTAGSTDESKMMVKYILDIPS